MACCDVNAASDQVNHLFLVFFFGFLTCRFLREVLCKEGFLSPISANDLYSIDIPSFSIS